MVLVQEDVLSLEVPVQNLLGVDMVQRQQDLHKEVQDSLFIQEGVATFMDELCQCTTWKAEGGELVGSN